MYTAVTGSCCLFHRDRVGLARLQNIDGQGPRFVPGPGAGNLDALESDHEATYGVSGYIPYR